MNAVEKFVPGITAFWADHGYQILFGAMATLLAFIVVSLLVSWVRGKVDSWVVVVTWIGVFGFSAEGMWVVTTEKAQVPSFVAAAVFFVAEGLQVTSMRASRRHYIRTTVRGPAGEDGKPGPIIRPGDPGKHARAVWLIAVVAGVIVASAAKNVPEALLRFSIPMGAAMLWWNMLTDEGTSRPKSRWRWTPSRLLELVGATEPAEDDYDMSEAKRERGIRALVTFGDRVRDGVWPHGYHLWRLKRLGRVADAGMIAEANARLARAADIVRLVIPEYVARSTDRQSVGGQSTERLTGQSAVTGAVTASVGQASRLTSRLSVTQLTDRLPTDGDRLPRLTAATGQVDGADTAQSTADFPTTEEGLIERLKALPRDAVDGTVTVADAARALTPPGGPQCGRDKARRLLMLAGLYRERDAVRGTQFKVPADEVDDAPKVNGKVPHLAE